MYKVYILSVIFLFSCSAKEISKAGKQAVNIDSNNTLSFEKYNNYLYKDTTYIVFDSIACGLNFKAGLNYSSTKNKAIIIRKNLLAKYLLLKDSIKKENFLDSVSYVFSSYLLNKIIPYWYGTPWDFSGYTSKPNVGSVGCSYFVSTTLKDMGLNVNRYKLAQQKPVNEALSISVNGKNSFSKGVEYYSANVIDSLTNFDEGLYFVGLSSHVGFYYKKSGYNYFIHSNYMIGYVMIEIAQNSDAFSSNIYYFSKISGNGDLALKWIENSEIKIINK